MLTKSIKVWLCGKNVIPPAIYLSQYDTNYQFEFTVYDGDSVWTIPEGASVIMEGVKKDGTVFIVSGSIDNSNHAVVDCGPQLTAVGGAVKCELRFVDDGGIVGTANFTLNVEAAPASGHILSEDDFSAIDQLVNQALVAAEQTGDAAAAVSEVKASVSNPFVIAKTAADMVDTEKGYVYAGSETGYTTGGWYYWNGTAWVLGGVATDTTFAVAGLPADSGAVGTAFSKTPALAYDDATALTPATQGEIDYNDFKTPGSWRVGSNAYAGRIANLPSGVAVAHRLFVITMTQSVRVIQIIITNSSNAGFYMRFFDGTNWGAWSKFALQAVMDTALANRAALAAGDAIALSASTQGEIDYNDFLTPGNWRVTTGSVAGRITNCPTTLAHRLFVVATTSSDKIIQLIVTNATKVGLYVRFYNDEGWGNWNHVAYLSDLDALGTDKAIFTTTQNLVLLPQNDPIDYNDLITEGNYQCGSQASAATKINCPTTVGHRLYVTKLFNGASSIFQVVIASDRSMTTYARRGIIKTGENDEQYAEWTDWYALVGTVDDTVHYPVYNQINSTFPLNVGRIMRGGKVVAATLPKQTNVVGETEYYDLDADIPAVLYSSVWRDGLDVYRNLTLETYYSALANPYSVLYTKNYTDINIDNAHSWYGGVCSTYVTSVMGFRIYHTTYQLGQTLRPKTMESVYDIEVGDMLLMTGHIAFISNIYTDQNGAINGVCVSQQTGSVFRTNIIKIQEFQAYLDHMGYTVMEPIVPIQNYPVLGKPDFNAEIIFERGNNTYITHTEIATDGAWFYIPNATKVYISWNGGSAIAVTLVNLPSGRKQVDKHLYDLRDSMTEYGDYDLTVSDTDKKPCHIEVINTGTAVLDGNTLTLANWIHCKPYNYYIVSERPASAETQKAFQPTEGYACSYTGNAAEINVDDGATSVVVSIPNEFTDGLNRYKVWIEYQTGCGLKQAFSNIYVNDDD